MRRLRLAATAATLLVACFAATAAAKLPLAPLSTLGHLKPAPAAGVVGPEKVPIPKGKALGPIRALRPNEKVDGIVCQASEKVVYHSHVHLTIFVAGKAVQVPYGIGIGPPLQGVRTKVGAFVTTGSCFMWLHTHSADGIVHVESPVDRHYTLGQFFAVWGQKLTAHRVGPAKGKVTAFYNGKVWTGKPAAIPLTSEAQIQLDVGRPLVAPEHIAFPKDLAASMAKSGK